jgi:hypothetical protein
MQQIHAGSLCSDDDSTAAVASLRTVNFCEVNGPRKYIVDNKYSTSRLKTAEKARKSTLKTAIDSELSKAT